MSKHLYLAAAILSVMWYGLALAATPAGSLVSQTVHQNWGVLINLAAAGAGTVNSASNAGAGANMTCVYNQTTTTGTPSTTFAIQTMIPGTTTWIPILTSSAMTTGPLVSELSVGSSIIAGTVGINTGANNVVPSPWRVSATVGGTTPAVTGTISCMTGD